MISALALSFLLASDDLPTVADQAKKLGLTRREGLLGSYLDPKEGRLYLEVPPANPATGIAGEYLLVESLRTGVGSNDLGLDRGQPGESNIIRFRPSGRRMLLEVPNTQFTASSRDEAERRAVEESFPTSIILSLPIQARDADGRTLVDATALAVRDAHGTGRTLGYGLDGERSVLESPACKAFPLNLEFEARLTFATNGTPNALVAPVSPNDRVVTVVQHQSLVQLPDASYRTRPFDPRAGVFGLTTFDFSAPLDAPLRRRVITRHRLERQDPDNPASPVKRPIVYYVDRGAPEPIRSALLEGARYWTKAFDRAGLPGAFRVELLPPNADPEDLRYNVIEWVHRSTRGYSYGSSIVDPRTGEILKGKVSLDSSRGRQDVMLFEGLVGAAKSGSGSVDDPVRLSLARLRQLAAHEVGHTLGFAHNFGASINDRASVMDYPAPRIRVKDGALDFSAAYVDRGGPWDDFLVKYAYGEIPKGKDERTELNRVVAGANAAGLVFLTDQDADEQSGADARAVRFDNGTDPVAELKEAMAVRRIALTSFGPGNLHAGEPLSRLEEVLGPVYFYHRYAVDAALRLVGGVTYSNAVKGDPVPPTRPVSGAVQREALEGLLDAIEPSELSLPATLLDQIPPTAFGYERTRESFSSNTRFTFDSLGAAATGADLVLGRFLDPVRCHRIVELSTRDNTLPTLEDLLNRTVQRTFWVGTPTLRRDRELRRVVQDVLIGRLMDLGDTGSTPVRRRVRATLASMLSRLGTTADQRSVELAQEIRRYLDRPADATPRKPAALPILPGAPIGD